MRNIYAIFLASSISAGVFAQIENPMSTATELATQRTCSLVDAWNDRGSCASKPVSIFKLPHSGTFIAVEGRPDKIEAYDLGLAPESPSGSNGGQPQESPGSTSDLNASDLGIEMVSIPSGAFIMGDQNDRGGSEESPVHLVNVPAFRLGKYEVTVGQFQHFVQATSHTTDAETGAGGNSGCRIYTSKGFQWTAGSSWKNPGYAIEDNQPAVCVGWNDVQAFITWLSAQTGETYRLPSEAEWEYAARASTTSIYHFGNDETELCSYANHADNNTDFRQRNETCSDGVGMHAAAVGSYRLNDYGLHDMHGNVWEWVQDCWNDSYVGAPGDGSAWTNGNCTQRVIRGGSWRNRPDRLRSANRHNRRKTDIYFDLGFRLAQDQ